MTSPKQTSLFTEDQSTFSPEASPVSPTQPQESDKAQPMTVISGRKCLEQFERFPRATLWAKTFAALLIGMEGWYSTRCKLTWKLKATKSYRFYFQLVPSTLPTEEIGFGLLPTVSTTDFGSPLSEDQKNTFMSNREKKQLTAVPSALNQLRQMAYDGLLPTPRANKVNGCDLNSEKLANRNKWNLEETVAGWVVNKMLPTPSASDNRDRGGMHNPAIQRRVEMGKQIGLTMIMNDGSGFQLNPQFVAEMMGFPTDWTELPFLSGDKNPLKPTETP